MEACFGADKTARLLTVLKRKGCLILDGGLGTELDLRKNDPERNKAGFVYTDNCLWSAMPLASEEGRALVKEIHSDFYRAGADIGIIDSYKISRELLESEAAKNALPDNVAVEDAPILATKAVDCCLDAKKEFFIKGEAGVDGAVCEKMRYDDTMGPKLIAASLGPWGGTRFASGLAFSGKYEEACAGE